MATFNKKRIRISSPGSNSDDEDEGNPKTHENGNNGGTCRAESAKSNTCFVCDGEDNWVLACHGEECPIAIHQRCISDEPDFDEFGNFYCPYCSYKRVVVKSLKLRKKLKVIDESRKGRETLGVDLGLMMDEVSKDIENGMEGNVSGGSRMIITSVDSSGNRRESSDESYKKFMAMEKNQRMKEVADESQSREVSESGDADVNQEAASYASERRNGERGSERNHEEVQVRDSYVGEERKKQRRCETNHEAGEVQGSSEKSHKNKVVAGTHEEDVFVNDEGTQAHDYDLGEGRSGQQKASSTESCDHEVTRIDKRRSLGSGSREGKYNERNQHTKTVEIETQDKKVSKDWERKRQVEQDRQSHADVRNDYATLSEQENGFRKGVSSVSSPMSTDNVNGSNAASQELALVIHPKAGVQDRPIEARPFRSVPPKNPSFQPESYGHQSHMEKNGATSNDPRQRRFVPCSDRKRKRIFWTQAEEEMLKVGVQKFPGYRNIPWRKILEYGRDVFQEERVPSDLKDKWKNMNKMSSETGKWVSLSTERQPNRYVSE